MTKDELITALENFLKGRSGAEIESVGRIDGEDAIGVEFADGSEYFIEVQDA